MTIYTTPRITGELARDVNRAAALRTRLGDATGDQAWVGSLRRQARASSVASSAAIEGYSVSADTAVALVSDESAARPGDVNELAVAAYGRAMDHVAVMAADPGFRWYDRVLLDLHFDTCYFQRDRRPGRWREGPVHVTAPEGGIAFTGPDARQVPRLMGEIVRWLARGDADADVLVRAAMAHLHLVSVHPFEDGNGRVARIAQSLVIARDGLLTPEFGSIEEYLGSHTPAYYQTLRDVQGGSYQPERDATEWIEFCLQAHISQAEVRLRQIERAAARWETLERIAAERGWPDRLVIALEQVLTGGTDRATYVAESGVSAPTASGDFRRLLDAGLVVQEGAGRSVRYHPSQALMQALGSR